MECKHGVKNSSKPFLCISPINLTTFFEINTIIGFFISDAEIKKQEVN